MARVGIWPMNVLRRMVDPIESQKPQIAKLRKNQVKKRRRNWISKTLTMSYSWAM